MKEYTVEKEICQVQMEIFVNTMVILI